MMLSCSAIDDAERRKECYDGVIARYQGASTDADLQSVVEESTEPTDPAELADPTELSEPAELADPPGLFEPGERTRTTAPAEPPELGQPAGPVEPVSREAERPWWRTVLRVPRLGRARTETPPAGTKPEPAVPAPKVTARSVESTVLEIPKRFTAEVTHVRKLMYDRQLVVLDGTLLFETERASHSRLERGDSVKVVRTSAFLGERYNIAGSSGGSVRASRLRCESAELGPANRRKCAILLD